MSFLFTNVCLHNLFLFLACSRKRQGGEEEDYDAVGVSRSPHLLNEGHRPALQACWKAH